MQVRGWDTVPFEAKHIQGSLVFPLCSVSHASAVLFTHDIRAFPIGFWMCWYHKKVSHELCGIQVTHVYALQLVFATGITAASVSNPHLCHLLVAPY